MQEVDKLKIKVFADGAEVPVIAEMAKNPLIRGFTTNPTLMRKANVTDYRGFARDVLKVVPSHPVSFEVFSDDFAEMELQAREIASWGSNVFVKIPVTNTLGEFSGPLIERLSRDNVQLNVTAVMTGSQVRRVADHLSDTTPSNISIFAGRIADSGRDPVPLVRQCVEFLSGRPNIEIIWASPRELLNLFHADGAGCHIITVTNDLLAKLPLIGKSLEQFSVETVQMFRQDALKAGFTIDVCRPAASSAKSKFD